MQDKRKLYVVSHTHWDREWYSSFQGFRRRLVFMMDELIEHMEKNEDYKIFHLDGQTVVLEDYLEIRPGNEKRLRNLIEAGKIKIGPWYAMPDEFLISGESLVRNLQKGFKISKSYGVEPMKCGYVTDIFGHNSQFPQILNGFGIDSALLFRGIGDFEKDTFTWEGADGSTVLCMKMDKDRCYSNFYFAIRHPFEGREYNEDEIILRMKELLEYSKDLAVSDNILMMDGVDHCEIEPKLPWLLSVIEQNIEGIEIKQCLLEDYIEALNSSKPELQTIKGELYNVGRAGVNNRVLKNVLSSMVHLKQENNECETLLTKWAEPFDAVLSFKQSRDNSGFFNEAWKTLILNHPHDSICGCSATRVHKDNEYRFDQVKDIAGDIIENSFDDIATSINTKVLQKEKSIVVFNGSQKEFKGVVEAHIEFPSDAQDNFKIFDENGNEVPYQILNVKKGHIKSNVRFRRLIDFVNLDVYHVAFNGRIPALGYKAYGYEEYKTNFPAIGDYSYKEYHAPTRYLGSMQTSHRSWENEYLKITVSESGTLDVTNKVTGKKFKDLLIFEDCSDVGDGWDYKKPLKDTKYLSINSKVDFSIEYDGPFVTGLKIIHYMNLPERMDEGGIERSKKTKEFKINTFIEIKKGSTVLSFKTHIDNNIEEHRLRVLFPNYINADTFLASTPFYLQERDIKKFDCSDYSETETGVYPNQGIVALKDSTDCIALYNKGLYEVEVTEDSSHTIALTLFRSFKNEFGQNRGEMSFMLRKMDFEYAIDFSSSEKSKGEIMVCGEKWRIGTKSICTGSHEGNRPLSKSFLSMNIPNAVLSSFRKNGNMLILRLYNCSEEETEGYVNILNIPEKTLLLDLKEDIIEETEYTEKGVNVKLCAAGIVTLGFILTIPKVD